MPDDPEINPAILLDSAWTLVMQEDGTTSTVYWPNCSVPDCEYKANIPESSMCYQHMMGRVPRPFDQYMATMDTEEEEEI